MIPSLLLSLGCARASTEATPQPAASGHVVAHGVGDGRYVALEAQPSRAAAELLPEHARYRVVLAADGELALVVVTPDDRILGHLRITTAPGPLSSPGLRVELDDLGGDATRVEAWTSADGLSGQARVGERAARWRVRRQADGSLAGESWSAKRRGPEADEQLVELRRARAIGADLGALATELSRSGVLEFDRECELAERLALAELALELGVRAWAGSDRTKLPTISTIPAIDDHC